MDPNTLDLTNPIYQIAVAGAATHVLQWMKESKLPVFSWISAHSDTVNKWLSRGLAVATTVGLTLGGDAAHGWTLHIPPAEVLKTAVIQYMMQTVYYRMAVKPGTSAASTPPPNPPQEK